MQTPEPSLNESQQQGVAGEEGELDPSRTQAEPSSTQKAIPDKQAQQQVPPARTEEPQQEQPASYSEEDILKGLVYPPPPTFYEKMSSPTEQPAAHQPPPIRYTPESAQAAISYAPPKTSPPATTPAGATGARQFSATRQPVKRSRTWIWGVVAIMSIALIASSSLCGWAAYNIFSNVYQTVQGIENTVNGYYSELQARDYAQAYRYLALTGPQQTLTQAQFTQQATQQDSQYGPVLSYTPSPPSWNTTSSSQTQTATAITESTITVQVGRKQKQYTVTLTLHKEGNVWKIVSYSQL